MRIAVMSDIHSNIHALEAVLADATEKGAEEFWNLGNSVSFGAFHGEVVTLLRDECIFSTLGSYDLAILESASKTKKLKKKDIERGRRLGFTKRHLSGSERKFLDTLPDRRTIVIEGRSVTAVHSSIEPFLSSVKRQTTCEELSGIFDVLQADIIASWVPGESFINECEGKFFVNPGSVGFPDDGDNRASYALLDIFDNGITASIQRVEYCIDAAVALASERGIPDIYGSLLFSGRRKAKGIKKAEPADYMMSARGLAVRNMWEEGHSLQVMKLSQDIFYGLSIIHELDEKHLLMLKAACMLHDIGLKKGIRGHHKKSMKMILKSSLKPFTESEKNIISLVARYHSKAFPSKKHELYSSLEAHDKHVVEVLSSIIRVADGLDRTHQNLIKSVSCILSPEFIEMSCVNIGEISQEMEYGTKKSDLMKKVFDREIVIKAESAILNESAINEESDAGTNDSEAKEQIELDQYDEIS